MGPKFNDPLYFEEDGALEVCGPANFGPNDVLLKVEKITHHHRPRGARRRAELRPADPGGIR
jgi:hypothetical protein